MPLGLIIFLLFNKYLGILSVLESKRHLTYAGHLAALVGNSRSLSPTLVLIVSGEIQRCSCLLAARTKKKENAKCFPGCNLSHRLIRQITSGNNWSDPFVLYHWLHNCLWRWEKERRLQEINSGSSVFLMHQRENWRQPSCKSMSTWSVFPRGR